MGEEIARSLFTTEDFDKFQGNLRAETALFSDVFGKRGFSEDGYVIGFEIEAWLLDHNFLPNPVNETLLKNLADPLVVPELSRFNIEFNCKPLALKRDVLSRAERELSELWQRCNQTAHALDTNIMMIGTLPVIRDEDLTVANISPSKRYEALNKEILRQRGGRPLVVDIEGKDHLHSVHDNVMLEAATTALQIHLQTPAHLVHRYYNASIMASAPLLAACVNAPYLFERSLWCETRIPLFEQSIGLTNRQGTRGRVTFGSGYLDSSLTEVIVENLDTYPVLLPMNFNHPRESFHHLRLHNGTIWRWNRPLIGFDPDGKPHVRIEHRVLPAGPTMIDMIANAAGYIGMVRYFVESGFDEKGGLSFAEAEKNFYEAARSGLDAQLVWPGAGSIRAQDLLLDELIPRAHQGLDEFGIDEEDRLLYLGILEARVRSRQTGANWQRDMLDRQTGDFLRMLADYCAQQRAALPVHQWNLDGR